MRDAVLALWPQAPIDAQSPDGRWLRFHCDALGIVYLQRYAWEEPCTPHFLLAICDCAAGVTQERHTTLPEAVTALRRLVEAAQAERRGRRAPTLGVLGGHR
jgi:hypothetical protein